MSHAHLKQADSFAHYGLSVLSGYHFFDPVTALDDLEHWPAFANHLKQGGFLLQSIGRKSVNGHAPANRFERKWGLLHRSLASQTRTSSLSSLNIAQCFRSKKMLMAPQVLHTRAEWRRPKAVEGPKMHFDIFLHLLSSDPNRRRPRNKDRHSFRSRLLARDRPLIAPQSGGTKDSENKGGSGQFRSLQSRRLFPSAVCRSCGSLLSRFRYETPTHRRAHLHRLVSDVFSHGTACQFL